MNPCVHTPWVTSLNATTRAGATQRIKDGAIPEQVATDFGISRSTLYRELRKHREGAAKPVGPET